jgi:hypothetical protein
VNPLETTAGSVNSLKLLDVEKSTRTLPRRSERLAPRHMRTTTIKVFSEAEYDKIVGGWCDHANVCVRRRTCLLGRHRKCTRELTSALRRRRLRSGRFRFLEEQMSDRGRKRA